MSRPGITRKSEAFGCVPKSRATYTSSVVTRIDTPPSPPRDVRPPPQHQPQPPRASPPPSPPPLRPSLRRLRTGWSIPCRRRCFYPTPTFGIPSPRRRRRGDRSPAAFPRGVHLAVIRLPRRSGAALRHSTRVDKSSSVATVTHLGCACSSPSSPAPRSRRSTTMYVPSGGGREVVAADPRRTSPTLRRRPRTRPRRSARDRDRLRDPRRQPPARTRRTRARVAIEGPREKQPPARRPTARRATATTTRRERILRSSPTPRRRLPTPSRQPPTRRGARARRRRPRTRRACLVRRACSRPRTSARRIPPRRDVPRVPVRQTVHDHLPLGIVARRRFGGGEARDARESSTRVRRHLRGDRDDERSADAKHLHGDVHRHPRRAVAVETFAAVLAEVREHGFGRVRGGGGGGNAPTTKSRKYPRRERASCA